MLRYMMDALAADQSLGGNPPKMFAFGSYAKGNEKHILNEWKAKNVTPILYKEYNRHFYLHNTLKTWANTWRGGTIGKESIVASHAFTKPSQSTPQDNFVGRMLWALSHKSGLMHLVINALRKMTYQTLTFVYAQKKILISHWRLA